MGHLGDTNCPENSLIPIDGRQHSGREMPSIETFGGEGGIRTLDTGVSPYNGLANRRLQPLGHLSVSHYKRLRLLPLSYH
jgi:hypothetical protein